MQIRVTDLVNTHDLVVVRAEAKDEFDKRPNKTLPLVLQIKELQIIDSKPKIWKPDEETR